MLIKLCFLYIFIWRKSSYSFENLEGRIKGSEELGWISTYYLLSASVPIFSWREKENNSEKDTGWDEQVHEYKRPNCQSYSHRKRNLSQHRALLMIRKEPKSSYCTYHTDIQEALCPHFRTVMWWTSMGCECSRFLALTRSTTSMLRCGCIPLIHKAQVCSQKTIHTPLKIFLSLVISSLKLLQDPLLSSSLSVLPASAHTLPAVSWRKETHSNPFFLSRIQRNPQRNKELDTHLPTFSPSTFPFSYLILYSKWTLI